MDEQQRQKLYHYGVEGITQIEEKRLKHENLKPIETIEEI